MISEGAEVKSGGAVRGHGLELLLRVDVCEHRRGEPDAAVHSDLEDHPFLIQVADREPRARHTSVSPSYC